MNAADYFNHRAPAATMYLPFKSCRSTVTTTESNSRLRNRLTGRKDLCGRGSFQPVSVLGGFSRPNVSHSLPPARGASVRRAAGDRRRVHRHTTTMHAHSTTTAEAQPHSRSFTSFTSGGSGEVNEKNDRRGRGVPFLFTSFTSFSKGGGMHVGASAGAAARSFLSPPRRTSERSERGGPVATPSCDYLVHSGVNGRVNEAVSFTSAGEQAGVWA